MRLTNKLKFKIVLHKKYFDMGMGITQYVKYLIAFFGLATSDLWLTMTIAVLYAIFSYFLGMYWLKSNFYELEQEVSNIYNRFVKEMREEKGKKNKKSLYERQLDSFRNDYIL